MKRPALIAAALIALIAGAPLLLGDRYSGLDHTRNLVPTLCAYDAGRSVLDPLRGDGPILEEPQGLYFAPDVRALAALFAPETAASLFSLLWLVLAAPCAAYLAGAFGLSRRGRLVAALVQPLLGTTIDLVLHGSFLVEAALVPLVWAGARNLRRRAQPRARDTAAIAGGLALLVVHGALQPAFFAGLFVVGEAVAVLVRARTRRRRAATPREVEAGTPPLEAGASALNTPRQFEAGTPPLEAGAPPLDTPRKFEAGTPPLTTPRQFDAGTPSLNTPRKFEAGTPWRRVVVLALSGLAGSLLACVQLLPSADLGGAVARAHGVESTTIWPLALPEAFGIVAPLVAYHRVDVGASIVTAWHADQGARVGWNSTPYLGALVVAAFLCALFVRRARPAALIGAVAFVLSLGAQTPLFDLALTIAPPLRLFRYPAKYFTVTSLCACVCVAVVVDALSRSRAVRRRFGAAVALVVTALAIAGAVVAFDRDDIDAAAGAVHTRAAVAALPTLSATVLTAIAQTAAFAACALLALTQPRLRRAVPFLVVADVALAAVLSLPTGAPLGLDNHATRPLQALPAGSEVCIGHEIKAVHLDGADGALQLLGDTVADVVDGKPNVGACGGPATPDDYMPSSQYTVVQLSRYRQDEAHGIFGPARALGCTHFVTRAARAPGAVRVDVAGANAAVYAVPDALPDASAALDPVVVEPEDKLVTLVRTSNTAADVAALVDDPGHLLSGRSLKDGHGITSVTAAFSSPLDGVVRATGTGGGVLALRRAWWPGWTASQAGADLAVVRVGGHGIGVVVDDVTRGPITLHYRVRWLLPGVALGVLGLVLLALLLRRR